MSTCRTLFARHRVTVHVPRRPYVTALPGIPTIRVFEALACGIPLVCSPWHDEEGLFGREDFLIARDGDAMTAQLAHGAARSGPRRRARGERPADHPSAPYLRASGGRTAGDRRCLPRRARRRMLQQHEAAQMNIAFYGSSLLSSYWNGAATYYRGLLRALAALGHDITFYEPDILDRQQPSRHRAAVLVPASWCILPPMTGCAPLSPAPPRPTWWSRRAAWASPTMRCCAPSWPRRRTTRSASGGTSMRRRRWPSFEPTRRIRCARRCPGSTWC